LTFPSAGAAYFQLKEASVTNSSAGFTFTNGRSYCIYMSTEI